MIECCFISNKEDIEKFNQNLDAIAKGIIKSAGIKVVTSKTTENKEIAEKKGSKKGSKKSIDVIAKEVIEGKWGNGITRKSKLKAAGYDYNAVQKRINELLK